MLYVLFGLRTKNIGLGIQLLHVCMSCRRKKHNGFCVSEDELYVHVKQRGGELHSFFVGTLYIYILVDEDFR